jgi:hypothetical protein
MNNPNDAAKDMGINANSLMREAEWAYLNALLDRALRELSNGPSPDTEKPDTPQVPIRASCG